MLVCPVCRAQVDESGEDGGFCFEHGEVTSGVAVEVRADAPRILKQLYRGARKTVPALMIGSLIQERMANARRMEAADPQMQRSRAHQVADLVFRHDLPRLRPVVLDDGRIVWTLDP